MRTFVDIPDPVFRKLKEAAKEQGISVPDFINNAIAAKLKGRQSGDRPLLQAWGGLRYLRMETDRIDLLIEEEFGQIDPEDWN